MIKINLQILPESPGVYLFKAKDDRVLYVGKAINLKRRITSYRKTELIAPKTLKMLETADHLEQIIVTSELEALLVEAHLIRKHKPFFNTVAKDDKHPLYIKITTGEMYPRVFLVRREEEQSDTYFGPFPSTQTVKKVILMLRRIFPFDTQKTLGRRVCFWSHIGLCNPCPSFIKKQPDTVQKKLKAQYRKNISRLVKVLSSKTDIVRKELARDMASHAHLAHFEEAAKIRDQIRRLDYVTQAPRSAASFLENPNLEEDIREGEIRQLYKELSLRLKLQTWPRRIECFDASHTRMVFPTVGMVSFINGRPDKNYYRRFRIRRTGSKDDLAYLAEALTRRFSHREWGLPNLLLIDGGKMQVKQAREVLLRLSLNIPVIGLVKPFDDIVIPQKDGFQILRMRQGPALRLLQRLRDEAHRFSKAYHIKLRHRTFKQSS